MIYTFTVVLAAVVAVLRGGRLTSASAIHFRRGWLILAAFAIQVAVVYHPQLRARGQFELPALMIVLSYIMLLAGVIANHRLDGMKLLGLGLLLNLIVIVSNGGFMPVTPDAIRDMDLLTQNTTLESGMRVPKSKDILLEPSQTTLWILSDIFVSSRYIPLKTVFSIGDVLGAIGLFMAIQRALLSHRRTPDERPSEAASAVL